MGSGGLQYDAGDVGGAARWNQKQLFVGTGLQINGLGTTYAGQMAYCTSTGSGFNVDNFYLRNAANSAWNAITNLVTNFSGGDGSDGTVTISTNTDLGATNTKRYFNLTVNVSTNLTGNSGMWISVSNNLTLNGTIHCDGKGSAGGTNSGSTCAGGAGAGNLMVVVNGTTSGTGTLSSSGLAGQNGSAYVSTQTGGNGTDAVVNGFSITNSHGIGATGASAGGGSGGALINNGGAGGAGGAGGSGINPPFNPLFMGLNGGGGGAGGANSATFIGGGGGGAAACVIFICYGTSVSAITINAKGGTGGNVNNTGNSSGGGGGGGGGVILLMTRIVNSITTNVTGGAGGTGSGGQNGTAGTAGLVIKGVA